MAIVLLTVLEEAYSKMQIVKRDLGFENLSDSDFLIRIFKPHGNKGKHDPPNANTETGAIMPPQANPGPTFACTACSTKAASEAELLWHFNQKHKLPRGYNCRCGNTFDDIALFVQHNVVCRPRVTPAMAATKASTQSKTATLQCTKCARKFHTQSTLTLHECKPVQEKTGTWHEPGTGSQHPPARRQPLKRKYQADGVMATEAPSPPSPSKELKFTCTCGKEFKDYNIYFGHQTCCGRSETRPLPPPAAGDKEEPLRVLPNADGMYQCVDCPKTFTSVLSVRQHWDGIHRNSPKFICKHCGKSYRWCMSFHYHRRLCPSRPGQ